MEYGHDFRRSRGLQFFLCLIFFGDAVFACAKLQTSVLPVFTRSSSQEPLFGLFAFASVNISSPRGCHRTPFVSRKGFSYSRVAYYPNSVSSFQLPLLLRSGDVHPNPGPPSGIISFESRKDGPDLRGFRTFYANARSIVNKVNLLKLEMYQRNYDLIVLTETHLDHSILDSEMFPFHYTVFRKDRKINGRNGGGVLIAVLFLFAQLLRATLKSREVILSLWKTFRLSFKDWIPPRI